MRATALADSLGRLLLIAAIGFSLPGSAVASPIYNILHSFNGTDGDGPWGGVTLDQKGSVYGTTAGGGACGTVFQLTRQTNGHWKETVLYQFGSGHDPCDPNRSVIFDPKHNLYATTVGGGTDYAGTVFELTADSHGWAESTLLQLRNPKRRWRQPYRRPGHGLGWQPLWHNTQREPLEHSFRAYARCRRLEGDSSLQVLCLDALLRGRHRAPCRPHPRRCGKPLRHYQCGWRGLRRRGAAARSMSSHLARAAGRRRCCTALITMARTESIRDGERSSWMAQATCTAPRSAAALRATESSLSCHLDRKGFGRSPSSIISRTTQPVPSPTPVSSWTRPETSTAPPSTAERMGAASSTSSLRKPKADGSIPSSTSSPPRRVARRRAT